MRFPRVFLLALAVFFPGYGAVVRSVRIEGTGRTFSLSTRAGAELEPETLSRDLRGLWASGAFTDVQVEQAADGDGRGVDLVFRVTEKPRVYLDKVVFSRRSPARKSNLKPGLTIDQDSAWALARNLERQLRGEGYAHARVHFDLVPAGHRKADLHLDVDAGDRYTVWRTAFTGDPSVPVEELEKALRATRVKPVLAGLLHSRPAYSEDAVEADVQRLRSFYTSLGYLDARVGFGGEEYQGDHVSLTYSVDAGRRYEVEGFPARAVCRCILEARQQADREGLIDFKPALRAVATAPGKVDLRSENDLGEPWYVSRISFSGNHKFSDTTLRRALVLDEGAPFDQTLLSRSLVRLSRLGLLEPVSEKNVHVLREEATRTVRLEIAVKEAPAGRWSLSGPIGTPSIGGSLTGSVSSRLPGWGRGLVEAPTYFASISFLAFGSPLLKLIPGTVSKPWIPYVTLQRPLLIDQTWKSGFTLSPQLGWKGSAALYGMTQAQGRLRYLLLSDKPLEAPIAVPVERESGDAAPGVLLCEDKRSRWTPVRGGAVMAIEFLLLSRAF